MARRKQRGRGGYIQGFFVAILRTPATCGQSVFQQPGWFKMVGLKEKQRSGTTIGKDDTNSSANFMVLSAWKSSGQYVSQRGCKSSQKSKIAATTETACVANCFCIRPGDEAALACWLAMYIVVLFTSGSCAPSFRVPSNFWLHISKMYIHVSSILQGK